MDAGGAGLEGFCRAQYPRLVGALGLYCGDALVAQELAQEALARACSRWAAVGSMDAPGAWVHRVAINLANSRFRRMAAERRARARMPVTAAAADVDVAAALAVRAAVAALPPRQRAALVLRYYADLPSEAVARQLGVSTGAVHQLVHRALVGLRTELGADVVALPEPTLAEVRDAP